MGLICASIRPEKLPYYEEVYSKAETYITLPSIKINDLETITNEIAYTQRTFSLKEIAKVFGKFDVMEEKFYDLNNPFMIFFDGIENTSNCKAQFILSCLPFCNGRVEEKAELVWIYTEEENAEGVIKGRKLGEYIKMIVRLSTRVIGKLISKENDSEVKSLMEITDIQVSKFVIHFFAYTLGIEFDDDISKEEYGRMLKGIGNNDLFSSRYLRRSVMDFITKKH